MINIIILFVFNLFVIILLSNIKLPSIHKFFEYKIAPTMRLENKDTRFSEIEIDKYHSLYPKVSKDMEEGKNNE